jgi:signal transduction histidine kinase
MGRVGIMLEIVRAPVRRRAGAELLFCLAGVPLGFGAVAAMLALFMVPFGVAMGLSAVNPLPALVIGVALVALLTTPIARGFGALHRRLAATLLGEHVPPPPAARGRRWPLTWLADGPGWHAAAYLLVKVPVAALLAYACLLWIGGLVDVSYPFWWGLFRNHPPDVRLDPVVVLTPFPGRVFHVGTFGGTFAAFATGVAMLLAAPWVTSVVVALDRWLIRGLLGPGRLVQRVRDLEATRAAAVDASAALLRQVERDLHDGAQVRLAALAMNLGLAKEKLDADPETARELIDTAHRGAKDALVELRDLARGIHPAMLDNGLPDALASLAAGSALPVEVVSDIPVRPTPAIETIAYFCAAELLANAAKHSRANQVVVHVAGRDDRLLLAVSDDGAGGADPGRGTGLSGLADRVSTVDGRLDVVSPPGGPTRITVELPLRA